MNIDVPFEQIERLKKLGVSRVCFSSADTTLELEFFDSHESMDETPADLPEKDPALCMAPGCMKPSGWPFLPTHCAEHGRKIHGIRQSA